MPKQKKSSTKKAGAKVVSDAALEAKRAKRRAARQRRKARKMLSPANVSEVERKIGVRSGAFDTVVNAAKNQAAQVAAVIMSVAAPAAIRPVRLADNLAPDRTSTLAFQQKSDIVIVPPEASTPVVGYAKPVLGRGAFLIADPLYPLWLQGRPSICGSSGQHFSVYRNMEGSSSSGPTHISNYDTKWDVDYSQLSSTAPMFGSANSGVQAPPWISPLGVYGNRLGWIYKPKAMMLQGYVVLATGSLPPSKGTAVTAEVEYYNGEAIESYPSSYYQQGDNWPPDPSGGVAIPFMAGTAENSDQPPLEAPGGNVPRRMQAGWYRVTSISVMPNPALGGSNYVSTVVSLAIGLTTDVRLGTTLQSFSHVADGALNTLKRPGFVSSVSGFPQPYTLNESTIDASFFPHSTAQYVAEAPVLYKNCRCTAASALFSNVTANINKEGTVRAVRANAENLNPWEDWRVDVAFTQVNPEYAVNLPLATGLYAFAMPDQKTLKFRDCVHDRESATGGLAPWPAGRGDAAVMDIGGFDNVMLMLFTDAGVGSTTQLQVIVDTHLEFKHNSPLWELKVSNVTPDEMMQAIKALQQMQHAFENPLHLSDILRYVQKAAGMLLPHISPFLVDTYNKLAAPATGYSIVPYTH